jgi:hypothetical protein
MYFQDTATAFPAVIAQKRPQYVPIEVDAALNLSLNKIMNLPTETGHQFRGALHSVTRILCHAPTSENHCATQLPVLNSVGLMDVCIVRTYLDSAQLSSSGDVHPCPLIL